ncbi:MAG TPA: molecular chaperone DnaK, partial [Treponema sp.]|nr:molecular chaperone DnaK [Treponema sp.]
IQITSSSGLSKEEIDRMVKDAEANADADKKKKDAIDARNAADSLIFSTEKTLKEMGDKVSADDKGKIESAVKDLKEALKGDNTEDIKKKTEALQQASYKIAEEIYKAQAAAQQAAGGNAGAGAASGAGSSASGSTGSSGFDKGKADDVEYEVHDDK